MLGKIWKVLKHCGKVLIFDGNIHPCHELVCNKLKACVYTKIMTKIFIEFWIFTSEKKNLADEFFHQKFLVE